MDQRGLGAVARDHIDEMFDAGMQTFGRPIGTAFCDKRVLMPINSLAYAVEAETGEHLDEAQINALAERGWFSLLLSDYTGECITGVPQYIVSRIGMFLGLKRRGYADAELRAFAEYEDSMVNEIYTVDELAYEDDDVVLLLDFFRDQVSMLRNTLRVMDEPGWTPDEGGWRERGDRSDVAKELDAAQRWLDRLEGFQEFGLLDSARERVARMAFRVRWVNEFARVSMIRPEREQFEAGFGFFIAFDQFATRSWPEPDGFEPPGAIDWPATFRRPWAAEGDPDIIRLPNLVIENGEVRLLGSPSPTRYQELWKEYDLEEFFKARAAVRDETVCLHCFGELPKPVNPRKRYCSESCRNASKQKRFRERRPLRALEHQRKYYSSLPEKMERKPKRSD